MAAPPPSWAGPAGLPKTTTPATAPTSGSMLRNAPAVSAGSRLCPNANRVNGSRVPHAMSAATATRLAVCAGAGGMPSVSALNGAVARAAPRNCTAVTAIGSRPRSSRVWPTVKTAESSTEPSTMPSPPRSAPPPPPAATRPTPLSETAKPAQATGRATLRCHTAAMIATSTGAVPMSSAAWLTLVRVMPEFWSRTVPPYPTAPEARIAGLHAARSRDRVTVSRTAAATANRMAVSQPGGSQPRAILDRGTVLPHSSPAMVSATRARRRSKFMHPECVLADQNWL